MIRELKPATSSDVGFAQGVSKLAILQALADNKNGAHRVIDLFQSEYRDFGLAVVRGQVPLYFCNFIESMQLR